MYSNCLGMLCVGSEDTNTNTNPTTVVVDVSYILTLLLLHLWLKQILQKMASYLTNQPKALWRSGNITHHYQEGF